MGSSDPFDVFRTALFVAVTLYYVVVTAAGAWQVARLLMGNDPRKRLLRTYLSYQLVSVRIRPLAGELVQIGVWTLVLIGLWWLH